MLLPATTRMVKLQGISRKQKYVCNKFKICIYRSQYKPNYNSLEDIDKLIERLETPLIDPSVSNERTNVLLKERRKKIIELRRLLQEAREEENRVIQVLEEENKQLDDAIEMIKRLNK